MSKYCLVAIAIAAVGCAQTNGANGNSCTVKSNADGTATISCTDGTSNTIHPGAIGATGATGTVGATGSKGVDCTVTSDPETGGATITCPGASTNVSDGLPACGTLRSDFVVSSQKDITAFEVAGCTEIDGNLVISKFDGTLTSRLGDLSGLSRLTSVTGLVEIEGNYSSTDNDPADALQITTLHGLQNLTTVGGFLRIDGTTWLLDAELPSLTTVTGVQNGGWAVEIDSNGPLASIELPLLTTLGGGVDIEYDYGISGGLVSLSLSALATIPGDLNLNDDHYLTTLDFPLLTSVTGSITINSNSALTAVIFEAAPVTVGAAVTMSDNAELCETPTISTFSITPTYENDGTACE